MTDEATYFWLSFLDDERPAGSKSLGVSIVRAADIEGAVERAWETGCNPGGEVLSLGPFKMSEISDGDPLRALPLHTLLSRQQLIDAGMPV